MRSLTIVLITLIAIGTNAKPKRWIDVTNSLPCAKIGLYDANSNVCYLGPNDRAVSTMIALDKRLNNATISLWKWNHGKDKSLIKLVSRP